MITVYIVFNLTKFKFKPSCGLLLYIRNLNGNFAGFLHYSLQGTETVIVDYADTFLVDIVSA